jgi:hypothetical protein
MQSGCQRKRARDQGAQREGKRAVEAEAEAFLFRVANLAKSGDLYGAGIVHVDHRVDVTDLSVASMSPRGQRGRSRCSLERSSVVDRGGGREQQNRREGVKNPAVEGLTAIRACPPATARWGRRTGQRSEASWFHTTAPLAP